MASFLRLKLRGVRSIGDEEKDAHYIEFLSPCTLISGPNGTGKTTTIEALNYITTGTLPSGKLPSFIHSTDMAKKARVDAAVTLEFLDVKKRVCTATRRMSATIGGKDKKITTKSEEFTLSVKYPDGSKSSISSKVVDFEKAVSEEEKRRLTTKMLHHLGVPKAIFNHVIFCHQEDSTWPLSEPKELKLKFDKIFQLTKFVKAQEQMKTIRRTYATNLKVERQKQLLCQSHVRTKFEAKKVQRDCMARKVDAEEKLENIKELSKLKNEEREVLEKKIVHAEKCLRDIEKRESELRSLRETLSVLRVAPFPGTKQELENEIQELSEGSDAQSFAEKQAAFEQKVKLVKKQIEDLGQKKSRIENGIAELKADAKHRDSIIEEVNRLKQLLRDKLDLKELDEPFEMALKTAIQQNKARMEEELRNKTQSVEEMQARIDKDQKDVARMAAVVQNSERNERKLEKEIGDIEQKLNSIKGVSSRVEYITTQIAEVEKELEKYPASGGGIDKESMSELIEKRKEIQEQLNDLDKKCKYAEKFSETEKEMVKKKEELNNAREKLYNFTKKHESNWDGLYGEADRPEAPWTPSIKEADEEIRSGLKAVENQLKDAQLSAQRNKTILQQLEEEERKLSSNISLLKTKIYEECGCRPDQVSDRLDEVRLKLKLARKQLSPLDAKIVLYEDWIAETSETSCCPVCERKFASMSQANTFSQKLQDQSINFPKEREQLEIDVLKAEEEEIKLAKAENQVQELSKMSRSLDEIERKEKIQRKELAAHEKTIVNTKQGQEDFEKNLGYILALSADISLMDSLDERIEVLKRELGDYGSSMVERPGEMSYAELKAQIGRKQEEYQSVVKKCDELQKSETQRNSLQAKLNRLRDEKLTLGENSAQAANHRDQLRSKQKELQKSRQEYEAMNKEHSVGQKKISELISVRNKRNEERRKAETDMQAMNSYLEQRRARFVELSQKLERMTHCENEIVHKTSELEKVEAELSTNQKRKIGLELEMNQLDGTQTKRKLLEDQHSRMTIEEKMRGIEEDIETLKRLGADRRAVYELREKHEVLSTRQKLIVKELDRLRQEATRASVILESNAATLSKAVEKLSERDICKAEEMYRDVVLEICLINETMNDLDKYLKCLDQSLIKFHTEKMAAVNEILDDLWRKVYNSTDIESIKIRTNTNEASAKNRAYDYLVVMIQDGGREVEMRGRCSAGQKMLASLLIRIGLAEVFGGLCSMIALDEPTTNLDDEKVEGMADILNELIVARQALDEDGNLRGRNLQMVVITHDERLVNKLTLACRPEYIYRLEKNEHGMSHLKKRFPDGREVAVNRKR